MKKLLIIPFLLTLVSCEQLTQPFDQTYNTDYPGLEKLGEWNIPQGVLYKYKVDDDTLYVVVGTVTGRTPSLTIK